MTITGSTFSIDSLARTSSDRIDDDGRPKRIGGVWTANAHIITAVIGSGVLALAWAVAQLGWVVGPLVMVLFALITYYTSALLADCYRSGDGKRNYTYTDAVKSSLGGLQVKFCGFIQYLNLFGAAIGYTITASVRMKAINKANCYHTMGKKNPCPSSSNSYIIIFGIVQIFLSQIPNMADLKWLSVVAAVMSITYSSIGLGLGVAQVVENGRIGGSIVGATVGATTITAKFWKIAQALGDIVFAYSYSMLLIEIEDTVESPPTESKTMRKANLISVIVITTFYILCSFAGYAAFGDQSPGNLLTGFGFYEPFWLIDLANVAIVIHLFGSYQVYSQPLFSFVEKKVSHGFPCSNLITKEVKPFKLNLFRSAWRTSFVIITTLIAMMFPFFNGVFGILGALLFWPLTVHFPVEMHITLKSVPKWSKKWISLKILSVVCLVVSIAALAGSVAGVFAELKIYKPFSVN